MPGRLLEPILEDLVQSKILSKVNSSENDNSPEYQPSFDTHQLSIQRVLAALDHKGSNKHRFTPSPAWENLETRLTAFEQILAESPDNKLLKDIAS